MLSKNKIKSLTSVEAFLVLFFSAIVILTLIFIGDKFSQNIIVYNVFGIGLIFLLVVVASIATFQFVKIRFVKELKTEIMLELDSNKNKLETKVAETNNRMSGFETNYSKMLRKISKDYNTKAKEIENIKRELEIKVAELDRKSAHLEIEFCNMSVENIKSRNRLKAINGQSNYDNDDTSKGECDSNLADEKEVKGLYKRIIELNNKYPGICTDEFIKNISS